MTRLWEIFEKNRLPDLAIVDKDNKIIKGYYDLKKYVKIRVFGIEEALWNDFCQTCENVIKAVNELGIDAEIVKVTNKYEVFKWVTFFPAVAFDDKVIFEGYVPSVEEIKKELKKYLNIY